MTHVQNTPLFNINARTSEYTVNVQLRVTAGLVNERGMYWVILRRYKQRPASNTARGTPFRDYYLGSAYYRDDTTTHGDIVLGGNVRVHFEGNDENFEIVVQRAYQQNVNSGNNTLDNAQSSLRSNAIRTKSPKSSVRPRQFDWVCLSACQQCAQQLFVLHVCRKRVYLGATGRALPAHDGPAVWARFDQFCHASVASPLGTRAAFR